VDEFLAQERLFRAGKVLFSVCEGLDLRPERMRVRDEVWILDLRVLRRVNGHNVVVEECYLHGALRWYHSCQRYVRGLRCGDQGNKK
jgi:hypothetical protein